MKTTVLTCDICGRKINSNRISYEWVDHPATRLHISSPEIEDVCYECRQKILDFIKELQADSKLKALYEQHKDDGRMKSLLEDN